MNAHVGKNITRLTHQFAPFFRAFPLIIVSTSSLAHNRFCEIEISSVPFFRNVTVRSIRQASNPAARLALLSALRNRHSKKPSSQLLYFFPEFPPGKKSKPQQYLTVHCMVSGRGKLKEYRRVTAAEGLVRRAGRVGRVGGARVRDVCGAQVLRCISPRTIYHPSRSSSTRICF